MADNAVENVIALWNKGGGWIPGAAYKELAEALGVDITRLTYWDMQQHAHVGPPEHRYHGHQIDGNEMTPCRLLVNGVQCGKTPEEHR